MNFKTGQQLLLFTILLNNEKLYFVKIGPNFFGFAVISWMIIKK